jgi:NADPH-dependent 2,4-dienoyl-CoA reductase/sulfur reductase-like enzyme
MVRTHGPAATPGFFAEEACAEIVGELNKPIRCIFRVTGLRDHEAVAAGFDPVTIGFEADDHKAYYPGARPIAIRVTGDKRSGLLLGAQLVGPRGAEVAKRVDTYATALFHRMTVDDLNQLDLSYTPPLGSPWDAVQMAAQSWVRDHHLPAHRATFRSVEVT